MNALAPCRHRLSEPGFTLTEMLMVVTLMGVFAVFAGRLLMGLVTVSHDAEERMGATVRLDHAILALREDVGESVGLASPDVNRLEIESTQGGSLVYRFADGVLTRQTAAGETRAWPHAARDIQFAAEPGVGVTVTVSRRTAPGAQPTRSSVIDQVTQEELHFLAAPLESDTPR